MRILVDNSLPTRSAIQFPFRFTCRSCKSILLAQSAADVKTSRGSQLDPEESYVECPVCKAHFTLEPKPIVTTVPHEHSGPG